VGGLQVVVASSGEDGIAVAATEQPDAVLLGAMMPGMDGPETLERLKADAATAPIPVVFLTGSVQEFERDRFMSLGAEAILPKPFDPMTLANDLRACLGLPAAL